MVFAEGDVLVPLPAAAREYSDGWPEFTLKSVTVIAQETGTVTSLLSAHGGFLVRVEGLLEEVGKEHASLVKLANYRHKPVVISDVATYSFSQFDDGTFGFWAAGRAGWFEFKTAAKGYQTVFREMSEATAMFYYLADKYKSSRTTMVNDPVKVREAYVKHIFNEYTKSDYCQKKNMKDPQARFHHHREFLIKSMLEGQEGLNWQKSRILRHFQKLFPSDYSIIEDIVIVAQTDESKGQSHNNKANKDRESKMKISAAGPVIEIPDDSDLEIDDLAVATLSGTPKKKKRKSILRPKSNKASKKFTSRQGRLKTSAKAISSNEDSEASGSSIEEDQNPAIARILSSPPKTANRVSKPSGEFHGQNAQKAAERRTVANLLPSYYEPRGPGDTWICAYDGCNHQVYDARAPESVELIKKHFIKSHEENAEDLINQESRPWASVDHLLERVKDIASLKAKTGSAELGNPPGVLRRY